jgi:hemerythrin superfamily protein
MNAQTTTRKNVKTATKKPAQRNVTQALLGAGAAGNAVAMLKTDHRKVEALFKKYEETEMSTEKQSIAKQICNELTVHAMLEEEIFYPACRQQASDRKMLDEAQVEHDGAKTLINELLTQSPTSEFYDAKVKVLKEYIKHHVGEEEKPGSGIFAQAEKAGIDMNALGQRLQARKSDLMAKAEADDLDPPKPRSLHIRFNQSENDDEENEDMNRYSNERDRDEQGRFMSDDDRGSRGRGGGSSRSRDDDDRGYRSSSRSGGRYEEDDDDGRRGGGGGSRGRQGSGWYGDSEGHSRAARARSDSRYESRGGRDDDEGGEPGWHGDPEGHSEAARRGWETREREGRGSDRGGGGGGGGRGRYEDDDDDRYSSRSASSRRGGSRSDYDDEGGEPGWHGDPEGHSEAARRGWETREREMRSSGRGGGGGGGGRGGGGGGRGRDDDDGRSSSRSRGGGNGGRGQGSQGGWFGDSRGHAEAARRGWENRD